MQNDLSYKESYEKEFGFEKMIKKMYMATHPLDLEDESEDENEFIRVNSNVIFYDAPPEEDEE